MVAVIKTGNSIRRTFHYNENKVKEGVAELLLAQNYPMDAQDMTPEMRVNMLLKMAARNPNVTRNSVHISLNFAQGEALSKEQLQQIATEYMERIGFGDQPFLVYQHHDAGHPHIHIASVKVRPDGCRIDMQNIGKNQSEAARKVIEQQFGLVKAEDHKGKVFRLKPVDAEKIQYGKTGTKRAITTVLDAVLQRYAYTSLPELNAVLNLYNVSAERGAEDSRTYKNGGLVYRVLGANGKPISAPIKASDFHSQPTLKFLQEQFPKNEKRRKPSVNRLKNCIDTLFIGGRKPDLYSFAEALRKSGIVAVFRRSESGLLYGITYVDHKTQSVFNGSALGATYSAKAITERCAAGPDRQSQASFRQAFPFKITDRLHNNIGTPAQAGSIPPMLQGGQKFTLAELLLQVEPGQDYLPYELTAKAGKKKKKRKSRRL